MEHHEGHQPPPVRTSSPVLSTFVLYAERSIFFRERSEFKGGDVGIHAVARSTFGAQLRAGEGSVIDEHYNVYSPSTRLARDVKVGVIQTNSLDDNDVAIGSPLSFPSTTMPATPLATFSTNNGPSVSVSLGEVEALLPGAYSDVQISGILLLNPGLYNFNNLTLSDGAKLLAIAGVVELDISGKLIAGRHVHIATSFDRPAAAFIIAISGYDSAVGQPVASFANKCFVHALLAATHGTLAMADNTHAIGAFTGFDITLGADVCVEFQSGFNTGRYREGGSQQLSGYYGLNPDPSIAPLIGPVPPDTIITLSIGLPMQNSAELQSLVEEISDPRSPNFRQYLTQNQFLQTYAPTNADYQSLKQWATNSGLTLFSTFSNNLLLAITASAAQIQAALYVNLLYRVNSEGNPFITVDREPSLDLTTPILKITGLTDFRPPQSQVVNGTGSNNDYRAVDIRTAYLGSDSRIIELTGNNEIIGVVAFALYTPSDLTNYDSLQAIAITGNVSNNQMSPNPTGYNAEVVLDIDMVQAMAPAADIVVFTSGNADVIYNAMACHEPLLTCVTNSWNFSGPYDNVQQAILSMVSMGVSCVVASGDFGDIGDPGDNRDLLFQTLCGGTTLSTNSLIQGPSGTPPTYPNPYYAGEDTWNLNPASQSKGVTSGGVMNGVKPSCNCVPYPSCCGTPVDIPTYQQTIMSTSSKTNGGSTTYRNYPDVAWLANNVEIYYSGGASNAGGVGSYWGTSIAAPLWAGFLALANQYRNQVVPNASNIGFINPTVYAIGDTRGSSNDLYSLCFNDIADGINNYNGYPNTTGYTSVAGYDLCTGLGTPKPALLYQLISGKPLTNQQPLNFIYWSIGTGGDNAGGGAHGSSVVVTVYMDPTFSSAHAFTYTLRGPHDPHWNNNSIHTGTIPIPTDSDTGVPLPIVTPSQPIAGFQLHLEQGNPNVAADNWDVASLAVSLFNEPYSASTAYCQLNLIGTNKLQDGSTGLVRLSKNPGSSGNGPDSPIYKTGPGSGC